MHASLILMALCVYLQWGRGVSVGNTISSSRDGERIEHTAIVANKLYIGDREVSAGDTVEACISNGPRDVRFGYDMGYPMEVTTDAYINDTARRPGLRCREVWYAQAEEGRYWYSVKDDRGRFVTTVK